MRTILIMVLVATTTVYAKTERDSSGTETPDALAWLLLDEITTEETAALISESISDLIARPYDLSNPDEDLLRLIPTLTELETMKLRLIRNARTESDVREILANKLYDRSRAFLSFSAPPKYFVEARSRTSADPDDPNDEAYVDGKYQGSATKFSNLVRLYSETINAGFIQAKDAGEPLFLDHVGGYCSLAQPVRFTESLALRSAVIGDYSVGYGEGLILVRGYARSKSVDAIAPLGMNATGIGNYLSTSAYRFYRGAATSIQLDDLSLDLFYSNRFIDATISDSGTISSLNYTGYHRTAGEQDRRQSARQVVSGANLGYTLLNTADARIALSATGYLLEYDRAVTPSYSTRTRFSGKDLAAGSLAFSAYHTNYALRGEVAQSTSDTAEAMAFTTTFLARPAEFIEFAANYRLLPEDFLSPLGGTFGDNASDVQNETGGYLGCRVFATDELTFEGYTDLSSRLERTPRTERSLSTRDFRLAASWSSAESPLRLLLDSRLRTREYFAQGDTVEHYDKMNIRLRPDIRLSEFLRLTVHTEYVVYEETDLPSSDGILGGLVLHYRPFESIAISGSGYYYTTDTYDSRIYITEPEVPGVANFNFLYGDGFRYSLVVAGKPFDFLQLFAKYSQSVFHSPSTDADERRSYITFQAELRL